MHATVRVWRAKENCAVGSFFLLLHGFQGGNSGCQAKHFDPFIHLAGPPL